MAITTPRPPEKTAPTAVIKSRIDSTLKEILDLMLPRAEMNIDEVVEISVRNFVAVNKDLLTKEDRKRFKAYL